MAAALVAIIIVAAVLVITHHSSTSKVTAQRTATTHATTRGDARRGTSARTVAIDPPRVRVAVLNGTETQNLAADVSAKLNKVGFQQGMTGNYSDQAETSTTVGYLPGGREDAEAVAKALGIGTSTVHAINTSAQSLVCPTGGGQCADQVVVTVGADLDSDA